jgi:hypothetical protein
MIMHVCDQTGTLAGIHLQQKKSVDIAGEMFLHLHDSLTNQATFVVVSSILVHCLCLLTSEMLEVFVINECRDDVPIN